ncbi:rac GTPase-activating protein 1 [Acipenser ruthenus]|uniref:rac GTPase-activating protein 1 n=1 Tax=Acipenser ruthenus TaxID=7906 RepID=UPI0027414CE5|nr:rac GTPase-activating protein 1 [Acipenser ruthenus]
MGEAFKRELLRYTNSELTEFIQVVKHFEECRKKWLHTELELMKCRDRVFKMDLDKSALEVKLKHARNQVDVEMKKRHRAETDFEHLERQMQLICDVLMHDGQSYTYLNEEQKSMLANFNTRGGVGLVLAPGGRLSVIDESSNSFQSHSDISYDRTDDDLDLDTSVVKPLKPRTREKRRSSFAPAVAPPVPPKRTRTSGRSGDLLTSTEYVKESIVTKTTVTLPDEMGHIHTISTIETIPKRRSYRSRRLSTLNEQTTVWIANEDSVDNTFNVEPETDVNPRNVLAGPEGKESQPHVFVSKTVIRPESCVPCGKRIRFGKMAVKCRDCRMVAHPECKDHCSRHCVPNVSDAPIGNGEGVVADFSPSSGPMIPSLVVQCVNEIEKRGLHETGIYRVPGCDRTVRELKEKYMRGKGFPPLGKVDDIHVVCGLLKDFLRKLKEPLVTFHLHKKFMDAGDILDDDDSTLAIYKAIQELPQPNKDTLAFLILHLQRVMKSPDCKMDLMNLSRVFGPTIVGHSMTDPPPMMIMRDTVLQPKVVALFLSLPAEYWNQIFTVENNHTSSEIDANLNIHNMENDRLFKPLTSPEMGSVPKTLSGRFKTTLGTAFTPAFSNKTRSEQARKKFFTSPTLQ